MNLKKSGITIYRVNYLFFTVEDCYRSCFYSIIISTSNAGSGEMEDFLKAYKDPKFAGRLSETIKSLAPERRVKFVHICGTA